MQEFLLNNTVNCNLMSLTGYRTLVILDLLLESPKSTEEINECFLNNPYIKEKFSNDTLRIYINSLRAVGCDITRANKSNKNKYELISHPFNFDIQKSQLTALNKLYKYALENLCVEELFEMEELFKKIRDKIQNEKTKNYLENISIFKNIDTLLIKKLLNYCKNKSQIIIKYKSPSGTEKEIEIICDYLDIKSNKVYLWCNSVTHNEYAYFRVDKIKEISAVKIKKEPLNPNSKTAIFELFDKDYELSENETLLETTQKSLIIELQYKNEFDTLQKFLYFANNCKIISPEPLKAKLISHLEKMEEIYR